MKKHFYILILFFYISTMMGQLALRKAEIHFRDLAYTEAAKEYEEYLSKEKNPKAEILLNAAEANYYIGNTGAAMRWYEKAFAKQSTLFNEEQFNRYILAVRGEERYKEADALLWQHFAGNDAVLKTLTLQKQHLDSLNKLPKKYKLDNLAINTDKADFGVSFYGKKVVYASAKDTVRDGAKTYSWNAQPYLSLYVAERNADGSFGKEKEFLKNAQTDYHNAAAAFSPDLKRLFVSVNNVSKSKRLQNDKAGTNNVQIVYGTVAGEQLTKKALASFNSPDYSTGQPAVSADGNWLFFVSDMPGGFGGTDIYVAPLYSDGKIGKPLNLGNIINTKGNEMFPFATATALYFSSDGHYGLGGLDVFVSKMNGDAFTSPQNSTGEIFGLPKNLGKPINSNRDDFAYVTSTDGKYTYLSSNRAGGKGDDDIYMVVPNDEAPCIKTIKGTVANSNGNSPISAALITATDADGATIKTVQSGADGLYEITLPCDGLAVITVTKPDFTTEKKPVDNNPLKLDFQLKAFTDFVVKDKENVEMIDINPIYFDFDQYYITPRAAKELDKVVYVMEHFPNVVIKIESHTDSRGKDDYNLRLSDDRAKSTYSYIISKGIDPKRIESVKGYGETQLLNKCGNGADCTEEEHQLNRRSNFIIVKK
ncbi:OmpA family protein [Flavobacterium psychrotrophum]|uniref:OmpA family protein n=1 Tax=Flavobacterium psychrotrophum TaxID=2294119 RepID=UPI0013C4B5FB|nr:OmpA family protein [Flavobacterium psychrotrophum]